MLTRTAMDNYFAVSHIDHVSARLHVFLRDWILDS